MKLSEAAQNLFNKLVYTPEKTIAMAPGEIRAEGGNNYYKPLVDQVDYLNKNQGLLNSYEQNQFKNIGYETIKNNAMLGLNSGLPSIENFINSSGLEKDKYSNALISGLKTQPAKNGFLMDAYDGYRENLNTPFKQHNWTPNENKGPAYRIGEGVGTFIRGLNNPLSMGLLGYGLTSALGGDVPNSVAQGLSAGVVNKTLRTQNDFYRKALNEQGVDTSDTNGWITGDMYKNYTLANYRNESLKVREAIANSNLAMKDKQELLKGYNNGYFTSGDVVKYLAKNSSQWGITEPEQLNKSNQTRNADSTEEAVKTGQYNSLINAGRLKQQQKEFEDEKNIRDLREQKLEAEMEKLRAEVDLYKKYIEDLNKGGRQIGQIGNENNMGEKPQMTTYTTKNGINWSIDNANN